MNRISYSKLKQNKVFLILIIIIFLILPLTLLLVRETQNYLTIAQDPDKIETEQGVLSGGVTKLADSLASGGQFVRFGSNPEPTNPPNPTSPPTTSGIYGTGLNVDSKSNRRIGDGASGSERALSHRFKANTTSKAISLSWELRQGSGYSLGNGGTLKISIQTDDGSSNHFPSGQILDSYPISPGNSGSSGQNVRQNFPNPPLLTKGQLYHVVWENISNDPVNNYSSVNDIFTFDALNPRQKNPEFNGDFAALDRIGSTWSENKNHTPQMDVAYADGTHDGLAYSQAFYECNSSDPEIIARIEGSNRMAREIFTVQDGSKTVTGAGIRIAQEYGTGDLTILLKDNSGNVLGQGKVSASQIPDYASNFDFYDRCTRENGDPSGIWVYVDFNSQIVINNGSTYQIVMSSPSGTRYAMVGIRYQTFDDVKHDSWAFREGRAQLTTSGEGGWENVYNFGSEVNFQFYFTLQ